MHAERLAQLLGIHLQQAPDHFQIGRQARFELAVEPLEVADHASRTIG